MNVNETVKLGASYLDRQVSQFPRELTDWRNKIDVENLDLDSVNYCILGQLFNGYEDARVELGMSSAASERLGFSPSDYRSTELTSAWIKYLDKGPEEAKPVEYRRNRYGAHVYRTLSVVVSSNGTERVAYEPVTFPNGVEKTMGNVGLWVKDDYYEDTIPYEQVKWAEGDLLLADKNGKAQAFVVRQTASLGLRPWILSEFPTWADVDTWGKLSGYTNFRKISF